MNSSQTQRLRLLRPALSARYRVLQRVRSTLADVSPIPATTPAAAAATESFREKIRPSFFRRHRGRLILSSLALVLGAAAGNSITHIIAPPRLPEPGTHEDGVLIADLNRRIDDEFKVKVLRGKCLGVSRQLKGQEGGWVELVAGEGQEDRHRLINSLAGAKGLGVERVFWNHDDEKLVAVIWLGGSLSGWPGVAHGGVIATQISEKVALAASLSDDAHRAVSAAAIPQRLPGTGNHAKMLLPAMTPEEPKQLSLSYVKPTYANGFYVVRVSHALNLDTDPAGIVPSEPASGRHEYEATLETLDARILVKAKARLAPSTRRERVEARITESAGWSYDQFKEWMWASRQKAST